MLQRQCIVVPRLKLHFRPFEIRNVLPPQSRIRKIECYFTIETSYSLDDIFHQVIHLNPYQYPRARHLTQEPFINKLQIPISQVSVMKIVTAFAALLISNSPECVLQLAIVVSLPVRNFRTSWITLRYMPRDVKYTKMTDSSGCQRSTILRKLRRSIASMAR